MEKELEKEKKQGRLFYLQIFLCGDERTQS